MKRTLVMLAVLFVVGAGTAAAQTRVGVTISFGVPFVAYQPRPYGYGYHRYRHYAYDRRPTIVVLRPYRDARVIVVRHRPRRHHQHWQRNW